MMHRRGMTLLELVVGLSITAMVSAAGYAAFASITDRRRDALAHSDAVARAAATRRALNAWIDGAQLTVEDTPPFSGIDRVSDKRPDDELSFLTNAVTPLGEGEIVVRLHIDRDDRTPERGLVAELAEWRHDRRLTLVLDSAATVLNIEYQGGGITGQGWIPSWISSSLLPAGVRLTVSDSSGAVAKGPPLLRLPLTIAIRGAGA